MQRIPTGIEGLDAILDGGLPKGCVTLISGGAGTLKTILCTQFIYQGATQFKEPGIFVTVEDSPTHFSWNMESFSWDIKPLEDQNLVRLYRLKFDPQKDAATQLAAELQAISDLVHRMGAKRLVIDSTTAFGIWFSNIGELRYLLYQFVTTLRELGCTTLLTAETKGGKTDFSALGVEEFISDGVIMLYFFPPNRSIFVRKMRGTNHSKKIHPLELNSKGILVRNRDELLWDSIK